MKLYLLKQNKPRTNKLTFGLMALLTASVFNLSTSNNAYADATIEIDTDEQPITMLVKNQKVLIKISGNETLKESEAIFDNRTQTLHVVDHGNQTIFPLNQQSISELTGTVNAAVGAMQQQMKGMTPEQRSQMEQMMGSLGLSMPEKETKPEVRLNSVREYSYSNIKCNESTVMEGERNLGTVCVSQGNSTELSEQDYQSLLAAQNFMFSVAGQAKQFSKQYGQQMPNIGNLKLGGLLVNSEQKEAYGDTGTTASFRIKSVDVETVEEITIPTGYRQRSLLN